MLSNLNLGYYYGTEVEQYSFYRVPKHLLTDRRYKSVSIEAKVLYGLLLDRPLYDRYSFPPAQIPDDVSDVLAYPPIIYLPSILWREYYMIRAHPLRVH